METISFGKTEKRDLTGYQLKSYQLQELIGEGGFGVVYRAYQPVVEREVAIKVILPDYANQPEFIRRFDTEAQLVARLEHMNIVPLYDYWRDPAGAYLVMRLMRGGSLRASLIRGKVWDLPEIARVLDQIGAALTVAHRNGVVHRDLKPDNILLDGDNNAYLTDFGIAKDITVGTTAKDEPIIGSPDYIAPEQIRREPISPQTDIYSLGVVLYEMLTGKAPFDAPSDTQLLRKHIHTPLPDLQHLRPDLPLALNNILQRATAKSPAERYDDALNMATDFRQKLSLDPFISTMDRVATSSSKATVRRSETLIVKDTLTLAFENPYKGLKPFREADAGDFFGREKLIEQLLAVLSEPIPFLAVVGPSGSGKSSVVKAGLIPALRRGMIPGSQNWFIAQMTPGAQPFEELEAALLRIAANAPDSLKELLRADERGLLQAVTQIVPEQDAQIILFIDQFEEVFTLVEDEAERALFLNNLYTAVTGVNTPLRIVITLRADFYDRPLLYGGVGQLVRSYTEVVLPLTPEEMEQAIVNPGERAGLRFDLDLVNTIIADVNKQPGSLPLLQYALTELFEINQNGELTLNEYQTIGGVSGALAKRASDIYDTLDKEGQEAARQIFLRLVTLGEGTEDTRRRALLAEMTTSETNRVKIQEVLDLFGKSRLLTFDYEKQSRAPTVEVAHEALIQKWEKLREWLDNSRDALRVQRRLAASTLEWMNANRDPSYLASGERLAQFEILSQQSAIALTAEERAFLQASIEGRQRAKNRLRMFIATLIIFSLVALSLAVFAFDRQNHANQEARIARSRELAVTALLNSNELDQSLLLAVEALRTATTFEARNSLLTALQLHPGLITTLHGDIDAGRSVTYSPDGRYIAVGARNGHIQLFDADSHQRAEQVFAGHTATINAIVFSPDSKILASTGGDATVRFWDVASGEAIGQPLEGHTDEVWGLAFSPDGKMLVSGGSDGTIQRWDVTSGDPIDQPLQSHQGIVFTVAFSPDGKVIASGGDDNLIRLWDAETGELLETPLEGHTNWVLTLAFSPDGNYLASSGADTSIILWDSGGGEVLAQLDTGHSDWVRNLVFNSDGSLLVSASADGTLKVWDMFMGEQVGSALTGHRAAVWGAAFSPDGHTLASSGIDGQVILWDLNSRITLGRILTTQTEAVLDVSFSRNGQWVAFGTGNPDPSSEGLDNAVRVWDVNSGEQVSEFRGHEGAITAVTISPDNTTVASASLDRTVILSDIQTGEMIGQPLASHTSAVYGLAYSPDGKFLASSGEGGRILLWDLSQDTPSDTLIADSDTKVWSLTFSPDGKTLASGSDGGIIRLWDVATGKLIAEPQIEHDDAVVTLAFSPDGKILASGSWDLKVILWDVASWKPLGEPIINTDWISGVVFSPDGETLAFSSFDSTITLWDVPTGQRLGQRFGGHKDAITDIAFSPDGSDLVSASTDKTIILWNVDTNSWQSRACEIANRNLTPDEWSRYFGTEPYQATCP